MIPGISEFIKNNVSELLIAAAFDIPNIFDKSRTAAASRGPIPPNVIGNKLVKIINGHAIKENLKAMQSKDSVNKCPCNITTKKVANVKINMQVIFVLVICDKHSTSINNLSLKGKYGNE